MYGNITIKADKFELLNFIEGQAFGSHLRQHIWQRCIDEFYPQLTNEDRNFVYHYFMRDVAGRLLEGAHQRYNREDIMLFIDRFDPDNQYIVKYEYGGTIGTKKAFRCEYEVHYEGEEPKTIVRYHIDFRTSIAPEYIKSVKKDNIRAKLYWNSEYSFCEKEMLEAKDLRERLNKATENKSPQQW